MTEEKQEKFEDYHFDSGENEAPTLDEKSFELPHVVQLVDPVVLSSKRTITEIKFQNKLNVKMTSHLPGDLTTVKMGHWVPLIAGMAGETIPMVEKMGWEDFTTCLEVVSYFLGNFKRKSATGGTISD